MDSKQILENILQIDDKINSIKLLIPEKLETEDVLNTPIKTFSKLKKTIKHKIKPIQQNLKKLKDIILFEKTDDNIINSENNIKNIEENIDSIFEKIELLDLEIKKNYIIESIKNNDEMGIIKQINKLKTNINKNETQQEEIKKILIELNDDIEKIENIEKITNFQKIKLQEHEQNIEQLKTDISKIKPYQLIKY